MRTKRFELTGQAPALVTYELVGYTVMARHDTHVEAKHHFDNVSKIVNDHGMVATTLQLWCKYSPADMTKYTLREERFI
jgi:hypothetical protein